MYTDHEPGLYAEALSNKGQLSEWRIAEVADLNSIVKTIHQAESRMAIADPLSRLCSPSGGLYDKALPRKHATLLKHLPDRIKDARIVRVHANKDTAEAARIVQRWRNPTNPISQTQVTSQTNSDFIIGTPYADRGTLKISQLLLEDRAFACLHPTSLINEIPMGNSKFSQEVADKLNRTTKIVLSSYNLTWIINLPNGKDEVENMVYFTETAPTHDDLLRKTTTTNPDNLLNSTRVDDAFMGTSDLISREIITNSVRQMENLANSYAETPEERHQVWIATRSGLTTNLDTAQSTTPVSPPLETTSRITPDQNTMSSPPETSSQHISDDNETTALRSGRILESTVIDPLISTSTQYIPQARPLVAHTPTIVPHFKRWVGRQRPTKIYRQ